MQRLDLQIKEQQTLQLTFVMRQSMQALELPIGELAEWLNNELAAYPALERVERKRRRSTEEKISAEIPLVPSCFQLLMQQMRMELDASEMEAAEWIIGNLDERGFFSSPIQEEQLVVLKKIQEIAGSGIAARDIRECLLIQLKEKENGLAYRLVRDHLEDLLHNRLEKVLKKVGCSLSLLKETMRREILTLTFCPSIHFSNFKTFLLIPDLIVDRRGDHWLIAVSEEGVPELIFSSSYLAEMHREGGKRSHFMQNIQAGKHLVEALERRKTTLRKIASILVEKMPDFFEGKNSYPIPLTIREVAAELGLHESTVARAVSGKAIQCIQGVFSMRSFFTASLLHKDGETVSNERAKQLLRKLIQKENKEDPSSDEELAEAIKGEGITCARRTVTKYRKQLKIPSASQRRKWRGSVANARIDLF